MPRTKVSKSSKRNRETTNREEKVREFENSLDAFQNSIENKMQSSMNALKYEVKMLLDRTPRALLEMKIFDAFSLNLKEDISQSINMSSKSPKPVLKTRSANPSDEGYITEDSSNGGSIGSAITNSAYLSASLAQRNSSRMRTPGPLSSARARRPRRSRSACENLGAKPGSALKNKPSQISLSGVSTGNSLEHHSRSKMRTPMANPRTKALSADRASKFDDTCSPQSPPTFLRFPKPGELVLSKCGSPLVSHMLPENIAHLNIPLRNGVISMRPKKLSNVQPHILEDLDPVTVDQLKTLKTNIDRIVSMVDKAGFE